MFVINAHIARKCAQSLHDLGRSGLPIPFNFLIQDFAKTLRNFEILHKFTYINSTNYVIYYLLLFNHESQPAGRAWGFCSERSEDNSGEVNPEPGGGERQKEAGHWVFFLGVLWCRWCNRRLVVHYQHHEGLWGAMWIVSEGFPDYRGALFRLWRYQGLPCTLAWRWHHWFLDISLQDLKDL